MNGPNGDVRLFFAAVPDVATRARIAAAAAALQLPAQSQLIPASNYHLTLAFIGGVAESQLPAIIEVGEVQHVRAHTLRFDAYDYWPKPEVVVMAARTFPVELQQVWQALHDALALLELAQAPKRLRPHVTVARKVMLAPVLQALSSFEWRIDRLCLMRSVTRDQQRAYTVVDTWPLLDNAEKP